MASRTTSPARPAAATGRRPRATTTANGSARAATPPTSGAPAPVRRSSATAPATRSAAPAGAAAARGLGADVSGQLTSAAPTFAEVLSSIGLGIAASQAALDRGVVDAVKELADKKVKFVDTVTTKLDDAGLPVTPALDANGNPDNLSIVEVSAINFFSPTVHEWKHAALSMDLEVGALDSTSGVTFSSSQASAGASGGAAFIWGFGGWFNSSTSFRRTNVNVDTETETSWSRGVVRVDAQLGPRRTERLPVPGELKRAPLIYLTPGAVSETGGKRALGAVIEVRKLDGGANAGVVLDVKASGLGISFATNSTTDANGRVAVTFTRNQLGDPKSFRIEVGFGDLRQSFDLSL